MPRGRISSRASRHRRYEAAIDRLLDKLERQVERYRDKRTVEMRRRSQGGHAAAPAEEPLEFVPGESPA